MSRQLSLLSSLLAAALLAGAGCRPQQPFYFPREDGDLSHYLGMATNIEYPDAEADPLAEVDGALRPFSLDNNQTHEPWDLSLEEAVQFALTNNKVMRTLGGQVLAGVPPDFLLRNPQLAPTIYDPALVETNPRTGVEAALAAFDTQFSAVTRWEKFDEPRNIGGFFTQFQPAARLEDVGTFQAQLRKTNVVGGTSTLSHDWIYFGSNSGARVTPTDWTVHLRGEIRQPLLQGAGMQFNRIAGPGAVPGFNNGVMIARINTDIALADFEAAVRDMVFDVENAYWELHYAYRQLDAVIMGRDAGLATWRKVHALMLEGARGGSAQDEAQARQQYFEFRDAMQQALTSLYHTEAKLRYLMGLASTDGRLVRPITEPTAAKVTLDWYETLAEGLARSVDLRQQKWIVKQRELELIAAKNYLLPRLDLVGMWQFQGLGHELIQSSGGIGNARGAAGQYIYDPRSNAYQSLLSGDFQNWMLGMELSMPLGFRREMAGVRHAQLSLARERAKLQEAELELSHQLAHTIRDLESHLQRAQTNFNRRVAAAREVEAARERFDVGDTTLDLLLNAQRREAIAESAYYRSLIDYNQAIAEVHYRKGSLLEYNGVFLAEGPWPAKAYFDARRRARARDASIYLDYGYTRPRVVSRGPVAQDARGSAPWEGQGVWEVQGEFEVPHDALPDRRSLLEGYETLPAPPPLDPIPPEPDEARAVRPAAEGLRLAGPSSKPAASGGYDLSALDLSALAEKAGAAPGGGEVSAAVAAESARQADGWTAVQRAAFERPAPGTPPAQPPAKTVRQGRLTWSSSHDPGGAHEPLSHPPIAADHRPASGWQRIQR
jgi:outer membrane protein TolC